MPFHKFILNQEDSFYNFSKDITFENIYNGRQGAIIVNSNNDTDSVPIVRSTTVFNNPAQSFKQVHYDLIKNIRDTTQFEAKFNNAMIEIYDNQYRTMGYHSDQALDIADDSYICIFSCYKNPTDNNTRKLYNKQKGPKESLKNSECINLEHNSVVIFDKHTNSEWVHKIVLENNNASFDNKWLGITFRLSKTFINSKEPLMLINKNDNKDLYSEYITQRSWENKEVGFVWPITNVTISPSDIMPIKK